jgi:hypothetical protein
MEYSKAEAEISLVCFEPGMSGLPGGDIFWLVSIAERQRCYCGVS